MKLLDRERTRQSVIYIGNNDRKRRRNKPRNILLRWLTNFWRFSVYYGHYLASRK